MHQITIYSPLQTRALHQHTQLLHKPLKSVFTGRLKPSVCSLSSLLRSPLALLLFLHRTLSSRTGQRVDAGQGDERRGQGVGAVGRSPALTGAERRKHQIILFLENADTLSTSPVHSFISFTSSFISHIGELLMASFSKFSSELLQPTEQRLEKNTSLSVC